MSEWKKLSSQIVYSNPWYSIREDSVITPFGKERTYRVVDRKPSVYIVALTADEEIYLVKISRYTTGITSWEVPAGGVNDGEELSAAARRELQEETGLIAKQLVKVGEFRSASGISNQVGHTFIAAELEQTSENEQEEENIEQVVKLPFDRAMSFIVTGEITDGGSIAALTQAALYKGLISLES